MHRHLVVAAIGMVACCNAAQAVEVLDSVFQVSFTHAGQDYVYNDATVPLLPGNACYNWYIRLADPTSSTEVTAIETFRLPEPLQAWIGHVNEPASDMQIQPNAMVAVSRIRQVPVEGWISNRWCVSEGDPVGPHSFAVTVDGAAPVTFEFDVVAAEDYAFAEPDVAPSPPPPQPFTRTPFARTVDNNW